MSAPSKSILVVEDDPYIRSATVRLLRMQGYTVDCATNGLQAFRYLKHNAPPRLILLDLQMPVMDGWQFRKRQQEDPQLAQIPTVILSSNDDVEEVADTLHADCLHKPFEAETLLDTLRQLAPMGERASRRAGDVSPPV